MTQRNDPCPCGSGRKFKKCCGAGAKASPPAGTAPEGPPPASPEPDTGPAGWGEALFRHASSRPTPEKLEARRDKHLKLRIQGPELRGSLFYSVAPSSRGRGS